MEYSKSEILDENGRMIPRDEFLIDGIHCSPDNIVEPRRPLNGKSDVLEQNCFDCHYNKCSISVETIFY